MVDVATTATSATPRRNNSRKRKGKVSVGSAEPALSSSPRNITNEQNASNPMNDVEDLDTESTGNKTLSTAKDVGLSNHPLLRDEARGMDPSLLLTGFFGSRGERIRHTVHQGALRLPREALEIIASPPSYDNWMGSSTGNINNTGKKQVKKSKCTKMVILPELDSVKRPSLDSATHKSIVVTQIYQTRESVAHDSAVHLNNEGLSIPVYQYQTHIRNKEVPVVDESNLAPERIRGGGDEEKEGRAHGISRPGPISSNAPNSNSSANSTTGLPSSGSAAPGAPRTGTEATRPQFLQHYPMQEQSHQMQPIQQLEEHQQQIQQHQYQLQQIHQQQVQMRQQQLQEQLRRQHEQSMQQMQKEKPQQVQLFQQQQKQQQEDQQRKHIQQQEEQLRKQQEQQMRNQQSLQQQPTMVAKYQQQPVATAVAPHSDPGIQKYQAKAVTDNSNQAFSSSAPSTTSGTTSSATKKGDPPSTTRYQISAPHAEITSSGQVPAVQPHMVTAQPSSVKSSERQAENSSVSANPALVPLQQPSSTAAAKIPSQKPPPRGKKLVPVVVRLKEPTEAQWEQHVPGQNDEMGVDPATKTPKPDWYKADGISHLERTLLPEWFDDSAVHRTPQNYRKAREAMIKISTKLGTRYLTSTMARRSIPGDAGSIIRLHEFLCAHGLINEDSINDSAPTPSALRSKKPNVQWPQARKDALLHAVVEQSRKRQKQEEQGSVPIIDWDSVAVQVGDGAVATECEMEFLKLEIPEATQREGSITPETTAGNAIEVKENAEVNSNHSHGYIMNRYFLDGCDPKVVHAVTEAALASTTNLNDAQRAALGGLGLSQHIQEAVTQEGIVARLLSEVVDLRMKKLENRLAMLDDIEGLLEAERVALELERRDLYTARCRSWFGGP
ncbi:hypothetical protein ACA910_005033 [Epithemia clementina (nom. ined.)]